jgi:hypothetical protein
MYNDNLLGKHLVPHSLKSFRIVYACFRSNDLPTDQEDEALNRWKASLGLGSGKTVGDPNDPRKCVIKSLALVRPHSFSLLLHSG